MAFESKDLSVLAYANGFTLWHYTTTDGSVFDAGYFDPAADMLRPGDVIITNMDAERDRRLSVVHVVARDDTTVAIGEAA